MFSGFPLPPTWPAPLEPWLNGKKNVLNEYYKLLKGTLDMDKFIDTYKFDYIMVNSYEKFYEFIKNNEDYELVYEGKNKITFLFKRKYSQT